MREFAVQQMPTTPSEEAKYAYASMTNAMGNILQSASFMMKGAYNGSTTADLNKTNSVCIALNVTYLVFKNGEKEQ